MNAYTHNEEELNAYLFLRTIRNRLTRQQYRTFVGQIQARDYDGFHKGMEKVKKQLFDVKPCYVD